MKYTEPQLTQMARTVLHAFQSNDPRSVEFIQRVSQRTGLHPTDVLERIQAQAAMPHPLDRSTRRNRATA